MVPFGIRAGRVTGFDEERGLGTVTAEGGGQLPFHCTAIAGGSRSIDVGTQVVFETAPGPGGRWWATQVTPC
ncbi:MAG TPA: cold shock domain-containing protein [Acidimicrobiales bacterium]|jgi:cold shock CspA family protein|nr:cold shock domain-containing protein [Acidimicrobiales bacterium]